MVLLIKQDKSLVISQYSTIYQKENVVNKITIYCPLQLDEIADMSELYAVLYYTTATNEAYIEALDSQESDKENYLMYTLPVTTQFTRAAGNNKVRIAFTRDKDGEQMLLHTSEVEIKVNEWPYTVVTSEGISSLVNRVHELEDKAPDDLMLKEDVLHLAKKNEETGELEPLSDGVEILVPGDPDDEDEDHDGVIDIDDLDGSVGLTSSGFKFMEL